MVVGLHCVEDRVPQADGGGCGSAVSEVTPLFSEW